MAPGAGVEMSQRPSHVAEDGIEVASQPRTSDALERQDRFPSIILEEVGTSHRDFSEISRSRGSGQENGETYHALGNHNDADPFRVLQDPAPSHTMASPPAQVVDLSDPDTVAQSDEQNRTNSLKNRRAARLPWYAILFGWDRKGDMDVRTYMVHPESPFVAVVHYIQYTGLAVPVVLAFLWDQIEVCWRNPMLEFDIFVDTFFLLEIPLNFCIGIHIQGMYTDDPKRVAKKYITDRFFFDVLTSIPVSYLELWSLQGCGEEGHDEQGGTAVSKLRLARLLKPLRLFRVLRVFRALKNLAVVTETYTAVERFLRIHPLALRFLRVILTILAATHLGACTFWWVKVVSHDEVEMGSFLEKWDLQATGDIVKKYIISTYFVCTVFTTVGFGDISGSNAEEQVLCIILMLVGVMVFGVLLSEVEVGIDELKKMSRDKDRTLQQLKNYLRLKDVSSKTERRIIDWVGFQVGVSQMEAVEMESREHLAPAMVAALDSQNFKHYLDNIPLLQFPGLYADTKARMRAMLAARAQTITCQKGNVMVSDQVPAEGLILIEEGHVRVEDDAGGLLSIMRHGQCIGEYSLIGEEDTAIGWGIPVVYIAQTHVRCKYISSYDFDMVLDDFPSARQAIAEKQQELYHEQEMLRRGSTHSRSYFVARARWISLVRTLLRKESRREQRRAKKKRHSVDLNMFSQTVQGLTGSAMLRRAGNNPFAGSSDKLLRSDSTDTLDKPRPRNTPASPGADSQPAAEAPCPAPRPLQLEQRTASESTQATEESAGGVAAEGRARGEGRLSKESDAEGAAQVAVESSDGGGEELGRTVSAGGLPRHPWSLRGRAGASVERAGSVGMGLGSFAQQHAVRPATLHHQSSFRGPKHGHHHRRHPGARGAVGSHSDMSEAAHAALEPGAGAKESAEQSRMLSKLSMKLGKVDHDVAQLKADVAKILDALNIPTDSTIKPFLPALSTSNSPINANAAPRSHSPASTFHPSPPVPMSAAVPAAAPGGSPEYDDLGLQVK